MDVHGRSGSAGAGSGNAAGTGTLVRELPRADRRVSLNQDSRLSNQVVAMVRGGKDGWFQTVTKSWLPADASDVELQRGFFLAGQEREAVDAAIFAPRRTLTLTAITSWECTLRCTHCDVLDRLVREQEQHLDPVKFATFARRYLETQAGIDTLKITFLGGEPLIEPELCSAIIDRTQKLAPNVAYDVTTNLAFDLTNERLAVLDRIDQIVVSVDGLEDQHNKQRHAYRARFNPFRRTTENLELLVKRGLQDKIWVQGAIRDEFATMSHFETFQREMMRLGVRYDHIAFETIHPTVRGEQAQDTFVSSLKTAKLRGDVCCKYRGGRNLIIGHDNAVYSDFYDWDRLGTLDDPPEHVLSRHRLMVAQSMPALNDPMCMSCPVIGYCWGGCSASHPLVKDRPSAYCDQPALAALVEQRAAEGNLA